MRTGTREHSIALSRGFSELEQSEFARLCREINKRAKKIIPITCEDKEVQQSYEWVKTKRVSVIK